VDSQTPSTIDRGYGAIATAFVAIAVYAVALGNGFAFDDVVVIPGDVRVTGGQLGALLARPYWNDQALSLYRPLTSLSFGLDWSISNGSAAWFHFTNILWHALASMLAFALLTRFFRTVPALLGALVFALHPVHVEAVANVVGRSEPIAATFFFAACLVWTARTLAPAARGSLTALCFALALFAKESAVMLPAILLLIDFAAGQLGRGYLRRRWAEYALLMVTFGGYLLIRLSVVGGLTPTRLDPSLEIATTWSQRVLTAMQAWPVNAKLLFFPRTLLADYGPRVLLPISEFTPLATLGLTLVVVTVIGGIVAVVRGARLPALALWWFPITILPVSNFLFPIGVLVAERTLYLPSFTISLLLAIVVSQTRALASVRGRAVVAAVLLALAVRTVVRIPDWQSTYSILAAQVRSRPDSFRGQWHMARVARARGDVATSLSIYDYALRLWPHREAMVAEIAAYAGSQNRVAWGRQVSKWGSERWPHNVNFHRMLAAYAVDLGDTVMARRAVAHGLQVDATDKTLNEMARAFGRQDPEAPPSK
jgi:hypothetical protein